jgi:hypothetical protein
MSANALTILDQGPPTLPAELAAQFDEHSNLPERATVPSLSYKGKVWAITMSGEETKIEGKNSDGDLVPLPVMRVIVLDWAKERGRAYYPGAYDPAKAAMPDCWSDDGAAPSANVKEPMATACKTCPMAAKGSRVTDNGKEVTACQLHRMIAVVPAAKPLDFPPLRLKLAVTSDYDGQSPDHEANGWFAFRNYTDQLKARGVKHTALLVTKMKFDPNVAYPKVLFSADKWTPAETVQALMPTIMGDEVKQLISGSWTSNGVDGVKAAAPAEAAHFVTDAEVKANAAKVAAVRAAHSVTDAKMKANAAKAAPAADEEIEEVEVAAPAPKTAHAVASKSVQQPVKAQPAKATPSAKPKETPAPASETSTVDPELESMLSDWNA